MTDQSESSPHDDLARIRLELPVHLNERLKQHIPWGSKNAVILQLLNALADQMDSEGRQVFLKILDGDFKIVTLPSGEPKQGGNDG